MILTNLLFDRLSKKQSSKIIGYYVTLITFKAVLVDKIATELQ